MKLSKNKKENNMDHLNTLKNLTKEALKELIPQIFYPLFSPRKAIKMYIEKFYRTVLLFVKDKIKLEKNFYTRHAFINKAISKYTFCRYLEIGVADNDVFNSIPLPLKKKYGVDPFSGGNYRMTSDFFFKKYAKLKFDVIFIDGLHHYLQCQKDVINSINALNKGGIIFIHDILPKNSFEEHIPRKAGAWTGDVWKVAVELFNSKGCKFKIINIDSGIGILKINKKFQYKKITKFTEKLEYKSFLKYYKNFKLINSEKALNYINSL
jgi:hypothetical protein